MYLLIFNDADVYPPAGCMYLLIFNDADVYPPAGCGEPADVVVVLDSSTSVGEYNFGRLKEYAEHLVREMNKDSCDVNLGFLKYSSNAMVQVRLGKLPVL